ncbi:hypothetical protein DLD82_07450 [Methanospirillum stamsii]|uniref:Uncharacterized protein n=1 Tax=Methanospirillum stamsii TaxID=1277351 RepID=A0A2V2NI77_9EURY|nr:hypothetical protein DLD82_07450 [Methanospirillum stamsii]
MFNALTNILEFRSISGFYSRKESTVLEKTVITGAITKSEYSLIVQYLAKITTRYHFSKAR